MAHNRRRVALHVHFTVDGDTDACEGGGGGGEEEGGGGGGDTGEVAMVL